jgi:hypothetical protein
MYRLPHYLLTLLIIVISCITSSAQFTKSVHLKPILKSGRIYYYDTKRVVGPYSLQIPLEAVEDEEVNHYFGKFKLFQKLRGFSYLPAFAFLLASSNQTITGTSQSDADAFIYLILGGLAADITFNSIAHHKMRKAIDVYNIAIAQRSSLNLNLDRPVTGGTIMNIGFRKKF